MVKKKGRKQKNIIEDEEREKIDKNMEKEDTRLKMEIYSEFYWFRSQVARRLFLSQLWPLLKQAPFFEAAEAVAKIGSS